MSHNYIITRLLMDVKEMQRINAISISYVKTLLLKVNLVRRITYSLYFQDDNEGTQAGSYSYSRP